MRITVASGKGGTGKTTLSVNLFYFFSKDYKTDVKLVDCDVEEPNSAIFLEKYENATFRKIYQLVPEINTEVCTFCKKCVDWCTFNAITMVASQKFVRVSHALCHSCGACLSACPCNAITEKPRLVGIIRSFKTGQRQSFVEGRLKIGSSMHTLLIKELKRETAGSGSIIIYDAPPGTGCPLVQTLSDTDYAVLVTEPTPFGLHDLKIAIEVTRQMKIPFGVIVNKSGMGSNDVYEFLNENNISLLGEIPFSKAYAQSYSTGNLKTAASAEIGAVYRSIIRKILAS